MKKRLFALSTLCVWLAGCGFYPGMFLTSSVPPPGVPADGAGVPSGRLHSRMGGGFRGYVFRFESCTGNAKEGTAHLTFSFMHRLAPQYFTLYSGYDTYAVDCYGNRYPVNPVNGRSRKVYSDVQEKVVLEIKGIPPGVNELAMVCHAAGTYTDGVPDSSQNTVLEFRRVPIVWE